jgi:hypothetical protein
LPRPFAGYLASDGIDAEPARDFTGAMAALIGVILDGDDRWSRYWWVDGILPAGSTETVPRVWRRPAS